MAATDVRIDLSVIIPVSERLDEVEELYRAYQSEVGKITEHYEFIYVLDGPFPDSAATLRRLIAAGERIVLVQFAKWFGEATALTAGFDIARGQQILTLPAYHQVDPAVIPRLIAGLADADVTVAVRLRERDSGIKRLEGKVFNSLVGWLTQQEFRDLGCGVRACKRSVMDEVNLYGDLHRFLPILARQMGFRVVEVEVAQDPRDLGRWSLRPGGYVRRMLDIATVFFVTKFTKRPLRFFGLIGLSISAVGGVGVFYLVVQRLFGLTTLSERPALILTSLLVVLGVQLIAIGLIGELIMFTHARQLKEYQVEQTVNLELDEAEDAA